MKTCITSLLILISLIATAQTGNKAWKLYKSENLIKEREELNRPYLRFMDDKSMSMGIYVLDVGSEDGQQPHNLDEVYYVLEGRGTLVVDEDEITVESGSVIFVKANAEHKFTKIEQTLTLLVFFSTGPTD